MHIAVEGCSHGELDIIYNTIRRLEDLHQFKIDLLLCCGDFQSVRNESDLKCMAVPPKFMQMHDFHRYYSGEKVAPILTIFIGGNHEASNYLQELPYGGWVAPNIYYLGYAGVIRVGNLRIGGLSGIYKGSDYLKGHFETSPYNGSTMRSVYHIRNLEVFRLKQLSGNTNIFMSHDWPRGIYHHGNTNELLRYKQYFKEEIDNNTLGSRPAEDLLKKLKPNYWFSGHLHVKFAAMFTHEKIDGKNKRTKFLALDKCLPRREFLQILPLGPAPQKLELKHDAEWLTILRLTNHLMSNDDRTVYMPGPGSSERYDFTPTPEEINETIALMGGDLTIHPHGFERTAKPFAKNQLPDMRHVLQPKPLINPQTTKLCSLLGLDDPLFGKLKITSCKQSNVTLCSSPSSLGPFNKSEMNITVNSLQRSSYSINNTSNTEEVELSDGNEFEISRDEETGDFLLEVSTVGTLNESRIEKEPKFNFSPITTSRMSTLKDRLISSPFTSSPRLNVEKISRRCLSLSKTKMGDDLNLSNTDLGLSMNEDILCSPQCSSSFSSQFSSSSPSQFSSFSPSLLSDKNSVSYMSCEERDLNDSNTSVKRRSSDEEPSAHSQSWNGVQNTKKFKRRNASVYMPEIEEL